MTTPHADKLDIIETCLRMHAYLDTKQWARLRTLFTDDVAMPTYDDVHDTGDSTGVAVTTPADDVVAGLEVLMDGLETQHLVAGHYVDLDGDSAVCYAHSTNMHIGPPQIAAENRVIHANRYRFELVRAGERWLISGLAVTKLWGAGNEAVHGNGARQAEALEKRKANRG